MACHSFWLVLLGPLGIYLASTLPVGNVRGVATGLMLMATAAVGGIAIWQVQVWLPNFDDGQPTYFVQRVLYVTATLVEFPIFEVLLLGFGMMASTLVRRRHTELQDAGNQDNSDDEGNLSPVEGDVLTN